jgi:hypothetical protein
MLSARGARNGFGAVDGTARDVDQGDHDRHFDQRADDASEGLSGGGAVGGGHDGDGEFEVVARGGERQGRALVTEAQSGAKGVEPPGR